MQKNVLDLQVSRAEEEDAFTDGILRFLYFQLRRWSRY